MKQRQLLTAALLSVLAGCSSNFGGGIRGSGTIATENRTVEPFTTVSLAGAFDVTLVRGAEIAVVLETDDNLLPEIATTVASGNLRIRPSRDISPTSRVAVRITHPSPAGVSIAGSGRISAADLSVAAFAVDISGSGKVELSGTAESLRVSVSGSADIQTEALIAQDVVIRVSGSANAAVTARRSLKASVSGSGQVVYAGSPASVESSVSGSGSVRAK